MPIIRRKNCGTILDAMPLQLGACGCVESSRRSTLFSTFRANNTPGTNCVQYNFKPSKAEILFLWTVRPPACKLIIITDKPAPQ